MSMKDTKRVSLNISGEIFETFESTLTRFPETLLGAKNKCRVHYCSQTQQYFFDRNRLCFEAILYFYQSKGTLNCPPEVQFPIFEQECRYFEIPEESIKEMKRREGIILDLEDDKIYESRTLKTQIWNILENPNTSQAAWIFGIFSLSMIWFSIATAFLETIPMHRMNSNFDKIELMLNTWFLTELIVRLIFSKSKVEFIKGSMNWVDIAAVIPYFLLVILQKEEDGLLGIFKTLKFLRVFRLFRLYKHSIRLKVVGKILKSSIGNLQLLVLCLILVIFIGGTFIYYAESFMVHDGFTSIPQGLWWSVQTFTSVGYGDLIPTTFIGKTFACCFMLFGVLTVSLPVLTIVSQFTTLYPKNVECEAYIRESKTAKRQESSQKQWLRKLSSVGPH